VAQGREKGEARETLPAGRSSGSPRRANPTHREAHSRGSRCARGSPAGRARSRGVPAAAPGPGPGVRPAGARSAGGALARPSPPPPAPPGRRRRVPLPGRAARGPLRGSAGAPGCGDSPRRPPRAEASAPRPIWGGHTRVTAGSASRQGPSSLLRGPSPGSRPRGEASPSEGPRVRPCALDPQAFNPSPTLVPPGSSVTSPPPRATVAGVSLDPGPRPGRPRPGPRRHLTARWGPRLRAVGPQGNAGRAGRGLPPPSARPPRRLPAPSWGPRRAAAAPPPPCGQRVRGDPTPAPAPPPPPRAPPSPRLLLPQRPPQPPGQARRAHVPRASNFPPRLLRTRRPAPPRRPHPEPERPSVPAAPARWPWGRRQVPG
jgi:hypothetical protein